MNLYPETDLNQRNLGWIISQIRELQDAINAIIATGGGGNLEVAYRPENMTDITKMYLYMGPSTPPYNYLYGHVYHWSAGPNVWSDLGVMIVNYPIPVADGGTNADNPYDARINLQITPAAINAVDVDDIIDVAHGGTNADNAADAITNLGITPAAIRAEPAFSVLDIAKGGTGGNSQATARTSLGLGTAAVVNVPISTANGGTGANNITNARKNLQALGSADVTYFQTDGAKIEGIAADANQAVDLDVHHDGYKCIGIVSVFGSYTGYFTLYEYYFVRENGRDKAKLGFHNRTNAAHDLIPKVRCIYVKDSWT